MSVEDSRALLLCEDRGFEGLEVEEFAAIISSDRLKDLAKAPRSVVSLDTLDRFENTRLSLVGDLANDGAPVLALDESQQGRIGPVRWTDNMGRLENGGSHTVKEPSGWLDAYWMGRYHGFILPPETDDPALTTVAERGLQLGAAPYDGPPMPNVLQD